MSDAQNQPVSYSDVPERGTTDNLLRTAQQHHVQLSAMADTKANIIITVSSIVLTLSLGRLNDPQMRISVLILASFTLIALLLAILAVLPKYRRLRLRNDELPSNFNNAYNKTVKVNPCIGMITFVENPRIQEFRREAIWMAPKMAYIGMDKQGRHIRVYYFKGATI